MTQADKSDTEYWFESGSLEIPGSSAQERKCRRLIAGARMMWTTPEVAIGSGHVSSGQARV